MAIYRTTVLDRMKSLQRGSFAISEIGNHSIGIARRIRTTKLLDTGWYVLAGLRLRGKSTLGS